MNDNRQGKPGLTERTKGKERRWKEVEAHKGWSARKADHSSITTTNYDGGLPPLSFAVGFIFAVQQVSQKISKAVTLWNRATRPARISTFARHLPRVNRHERISLRIATIVIAWRERYLSYYHVLLQVSENRGSPSGRDWMNVRLVWSFLI